jgi:hypothetical protein
LILEQCSLALEQCVIEVTLREVIKELCEVIGLAIVGFLVYVGIIEFLEEIQYSIRRAADRYKGELYERSG